MWHGRKMAKARHFISQWRNYRGLTQEQLAERIHKDRSYISKIEGGVKRYDQPFLEAAAIALGCKPFDLIMRDPTQPGAIWSIWAKIPEDDRERAARILEAFIKNTDEES